MKFSGTFIHTLAATLNAAIGVSIIFTHRSFVAVQPAALVSVIEIVPKPVAPQRTVTQLDVALPTIVPPTTL